MAAGLNPDKFWRETPRSFVAIMDGVTRAASRKYDHAIFVAWHVAAFGNAAQAGKLKPLSKYLGIKPKAQTPEEMLAALQVLKEAGAPMDIREIN